MATTLTRALTVLIIGTVISSISACKKSTYYQLTDEEMAWLVYKNNEILNFQNQNGDGVSYYVTIRTKSYNLEGNVYNEYTNAQFLQLDDTTAIFSTDSRGVHQMSKSESGFLVTLTWPHFPLQNVPLTATSTTAATIGGINYDDIFYLDATGATDIRFYNQKLWVSRSMGVVQIEDDAGNLWVRQF